MQYRTLGRLTGMRRAEEVEQNNSVSDNTALRLGLEEVHTRFFPSQ